MDRVISILRSQFQQAVYEYPLNRDLPMFVDADLTIVPPNVGDPMIVPPGDGGPNVGDPMTVPPSDGGPMIVPLSDGDLMTVPPNHGDPMTVPSNHSDPMTVPSNHSDPMTVPSNHSDPMTVPPNVHITFGHRYVPSNYSGSMTVPPNAQHVTLGHRFDPSPEPSPSPTLPSPTPDPSEQTADQPRLKYTGIERLLHRNNSKPVSRELPEHIRQHSVLAELLAYMRQHFALTDYLICRIGNVQTVHGKLIDRIWCKNALIDSSIWIDLNFRVVAALERENNSVALPFPQRGVMCDNCNDVTFISYTPSGGNYTTCPICRHGDDDVTTDGDDDDEGHIFCAGCKTLYGISYCCHANNGCTKDCNYSRLIIGFRHNGIYRDGMPRFDSYEQYLAVRADYEFSWICTCRGKNNDCPKAYHKIGKGQGCQVNLSTLLELNGEELEEVN